MKKLTIVAISCVVFAVAGCNDAPMQPTSETELRLGTTITVSIYDDPPKDAFRLVFERVREIEAGMSTSTEDYSSTEILTVNRRGAQEPVAVSPDTFHVVRRGLEFGEISKGAFDITVAPLVRLWGIGTDAAGIPDQQEIDALLPLVDYRLVTLDPAATSISLKKAGMGIDVGGIAKGYAADESVRILRDLGVDHALLDFGGNIVTLGLKPDGSRWRIGIQNPNQIRGSYVGIVEIAEEAVVTSGPYERYFVVDDVRYHHILNPEDGYPVRNGLSSVTVVSPDSTAADALSTACYVLGLAQGLSLVESLPNIEAIFITETKDVHVSSGLADRFSISNAEFRLAGAGAGAEAQTTDTADARQDR